jgi:ribonuclease HI
MNNVIQHKSLAVPTAAPDTAVRYLGLYNTPVNNNHSTTIVKLQAKLGRVLYRINAERLGNEAARYVTRAVAGGAVRFTGAVVAHPNLTAILKKFDSITVASAHQRATGLRYQFAAPVYSKYGYHMPNMEVTAATAAVVTTLRFANEDPLHTPIPALYDAQVKRLSEQNKTPTMVYAHPKTITKQQRETTAMAEAVSVLQQFGLHVASRLFPQPPLDTTQHRQAHSTVTSYDKHEMNPVARITLESIFGSRAEYLTWQKLMQQGYRGVPLPTHLRYLDQVSADSAHTELRPPQTLAATAGDARHAHKMQNTNAKWYKMLVQALNQWHMKPPAERTAEPNRVHRLPTPVLASELDYRTVIGSARRVVAQSPQTLLRTDAERLAWTLAKNAQETTAVTHAEDTVDDTLARCVGTYVQCHTDGSVKGHHENSHVILIIDGVLHKHSSTRLTQPDKGDKPKSDRAELQAILDGLSNLPRSTTHVDVFSDCEHNVDTLRFVWDHWTLGTHMHLANRANSHLWQQVMRHRAEKAHLSLNATWVKAHTRRPESPFYFNRMADHAAAIAHTVANATPSAYIPEGAPTNVVCDELLQRALPDAPQHSIEDVVERHWLARWAERPGEHGDFARCVLQGIKTQTLAPWMEKLRAVVPSNLYATVMRFRLNQVHTVVQANRMRNIPLPHTGTACPSCGPHREISTRHLQICPATANTMRGAQMKWSRQMLAAVPNLWRRWETMPDQRTFHTMVTKVDDDKDLLVPFCEGRNSAVMYREVQSDEVLCSWTAETFMWLVRNITVPDKFAALWNLAQWLRQNKTPLKKNGWCAGGLIDVLVDCFDCIGELCSVSVNAHPRLRYHVSGRKGDTDFGCIYDIFSDETREMVRHPDREGKTFELNPEYSEGTSLRSSAFMRKTIQWVADELKWADAHDRDITFMLVIPYEEGRPAWKSVEAVRKDCGEDSARVVLLLPKGSFGFTPPMAWEGSHPEDRANTDKPMTRSTKAEMRVPEYSMGAAAARKLRNKMHTNTTIITNSVASFDTAVIDCSSAKARHNHDSRRYSDTSLAAIREWHTLHCAQNTSIDTEVALIMGPQWRKNGVASADMADALRNDPAWTLTHHAFPWDAKWEWHQGLRDGCHAAKRVSELSPVWWLTTCLHVDIQQLPLIFGRHYSSSAYRRAVCVGMATVWATLEPHITLKDTRTDDEKTQARTRRVGNAADMILRAFQLPPSAIARPQHHLGGNDECDDLMQRFRASMQSNDTTPSSESVEDSVGDPPSPPGDAPALSKAPSCPTAAMGAGACGICPACIARDS